MDPATLNTKQTAQYLGISWPTLKKYVAAGKIPGPVFKEGGVIRWSKATLDKWLMGKQTTEEPQA